MKALNNGGARKRVTHPVSPTGVSRVKQDGARQTSVSDMMRRVDFKHGGALPSGTRQPMFADFTHPAFNDFHVAQNLVNEVKTEFMKLPAHVRAHFHNDPMRLSEALNDPDRNEELHKLGLKAKVEFRKKEPPVKEAPKPDEKPDA